MSGKPELTAIDILLTLDEPMIQRAVTTNKKLLEGFSEGLKLDETHIYNIPTIAPKGEYEGTGIGFVIAQKIIHQHGGQIWAESKSGKGSTFNLQYQSEAIKLNLNLRT